MRVTIATASGQVKTVLDVSGWQSGERGWRAKTWRNKRMREVGLSAGIRRNLKTKEEHNATMIVVTDHLSFPFQSSQTWVTILKTDVMISMDCQMCRFYYVRASALLVWLLLIC